MLRYIAKRVLEVIPTLLLITFFVFMFVRMIPGDPARLVAGADATGETIDMIREQLGLNKPLLTQYLDYMAGLLGGDLGTSLKTNRAVSYEIGLRYGNTIKLAAASLIWSGIVGILIGIWSGKNRSK